MSSQGSEALLSPSDVADLAGVGRSVVSNWRKRHGDFPSAVAGTEAKPLFAKRAVISWLRGRGYKVEVEASDDIWSALNAIRGLVRIEDAGNFVLLLATLKRVRPNTFKRVANTHPTKQGVTLREAVAELRQVSGLQDLREPARDLLEREPGLPLVIDAVARIDDADLARSVDAALERLSRWQIKGGAESGFVGSRTSALLASLAGEGSGTIYDPACGIANVLIRVATRGSGSRLVGSDVNRDALCIAAQRAFLHGVSIELLEGDILVGDPDPNLRADVVVAEPPFGMAWDHSSAITDPRFSFGVPPRMASDLAWIQHAIAHLAPGGRGYVLTTPGALFRSGVERQIRANLLSAGCVEAVVALPTKMLPHTSIGLALWVIRPRTEPGEILLIDASNEDVDQVASKVGAWLNPSVAKRVEADAPHASMGVVDLLAADAALTPAKWVGGLSVDKDSITAAFARGSSALSHTMRMIADSSVVLDQLADLPEPRVATVRELIESGIVDLRPGRPDKARSSDSELEMRIVRAADVKSGSLPDPGGLTDTAEPELTEPGDVLVTTMNEVRTVVDETGGHLGSTGVDRLRILDPAAITPSYLAAVLAGSWNARLQAGSTIQRAPIRDLEVPLIPVSYQAKVAQALVAVGAVRELSRQLEAQARETLNSLLDAIRYNAPLAPGASAQAVERPPAGGRGHDENTQPEGTE